MPSNSKPARSKPASGDQEGKSAPRKAQQSGANDEELIPEQHSKGALVERDGHNPFAVVGIGASAGGLEAFRDLLGELPANPGMAFVLVQHLAPQHESRLAELLSKSTRLRVTEARNGLAIERDHVYIIPPNSNLAIAQGLLHLTPRGEAHGPHLPVDYLFRSLAEDQQGRAIAVVLSGTGSDGTLGLCEVKAVGGITFAQDGKSAAHDGMPNSARESGCVDFILPPAEIAKRLVEIGAHPYLASATRPVGPQEEGAEENLRRVLSIVRQVTGVDFGLYRMTTIRRRIMRRMALHRQQSLADYVQRVEKDSSEVVALYHDLLINVTSFFRDPKMFDALKQHVFPQLAKRKSPAQPYRIWVPGCSTGQEAYSLAMTLLEFHDSRPVRPNIQIFATDLSDPPALEKARAGIYPDTIEAEVSPERLRRFFKKEDHSYRIDKSIRDMCIFARQNVTADPPFSHLDLISCRNVLIYLATPLQKRVLPTFHYALDVPGFLVLGSSESVGDHGDLFEVVERTHKIYAKRPAKTKAIVHFPSEDFRSFNVAARARASSPQAIDVEKEADRILLGRFAPPAVLLNQNFDILQFRGRTSAYLEAPAGEPTANILKMARDGIFLELRSALAEAQKSGKPVRRKGVRVRDHDVDREIALEVLPVQASAETSGCLLVVFHDAKAQAHAASKPSASDAEDATRGAGGKAAAWKRELEHMRQELAATREYTQSLVEQQDAANEELRSANEEILSSNEELQSSNEELETAKEELQSTNEELTTVNEQLQVRNVELTQANNDLTNLLGSTNIPLVMVGADLRIRRFTEPARQIMKLLPADIGRPIGDIRTIPDLDHLEELILQVIEQVQTVEREVHGADGRWYTLRIAPYRTSARGVEGAVILLVDVDQIRRGQDDLQKQTRVLREQAALLELSHDAVIVRDAGDRVRFWNHGAAEMYGYTADEARGQELQQLLRTDPASWTTLVTTLEATGYWEGELRQKHRDGRDLLVYSRETLIRAEKGVPATVLSIKRDISENRRLVDALKEASRQKDRFLATLAHELRNPLAPIRNALEILRLAGDDPEAIPKLREILERQVRQLGGIVEDLLDVSRIIEKKMKLRIECVPVARVVSTAVESCIAQIEANRHQLTVKLSPKPLFLEVDPVRMSQVLVNLLNNSAKFTPPGGQIWLEVASEGGTGSETQRQVVIRVRDTGIGISEASKARIFEMFEQGSPSTDGSSSGLGIGLTLVRSLIQLSGGTVEVKSDGVNRGSEFVIRLPAVIPIVGEPSAVGAGSGSSKGNHTFTRRKVLVVDDNRDQAESLATMLDLMGHETRLAYDGEEALRIAGGFLPDFALVDIGLPKVSGYEVARRMRANPQLADAVLIAQTGWGQDEDRRRTQEAGFDYHLVKPTDPDTLRKILEQKPNSKSA